MLEKQKYKQKYVAEIEIFRKKLHVGEIEIFLKNNSMLEKEKY